MQIEISKVSPDGSTYEGDEPSDILELEKARLVKPDKSIHYHFFAQVVSQKLIVTGTLRMGAQLECVRCVEFFSTMVEDLSFLRAYEITEGMEWVDVTGDIRENILLALPLYALCSPGCKGLCPQCGQDLNEGQCSCRPQNKDGRWGALDKLKLE